VCIHVCQDLDGTLTVLILLATNQHLPQTAQTATGSSVDLWPSNLPDGSTQDQQAVAGMAG
jgi:hypothetical protein